MNNFIINVLKDIVYNQRADQVWGSANQLLLILTEEKEGQGHIKSEFIEKYKEENNDNNRVQRKDL